MENYGYNLIGEMLIGLGTALKDEKSDLRRRFKLSREQLMTLLGIIRLAASPDIQRKYIWDLADRWNVSEKTVRNWINLGLVREGRKIARDTRHSWSAEELDEDERILIKRGYLKPRHHHRLGYFLKMINGFKS